MFVLVGFVFLLTSATTQAQYSFIWDFSGSAPVGSLTLSGPTFFGMTGGTLFKINTDGSGYTSLYNFGGAGPNDTLTLSGSTFYGVTQEGGINNYGTLFKIKSDGTGYAILHNFTGGPGDGFNPSSSPTLSGSTLYGMTPAGGTGGNGVIFKINSDGTGYSTIHNFTGSPGDGSGPSGSLTLSGSTLFGMTMNGGSVGAGVVFKINNDGTGFTILHNFTGSDEYHPVGSLTLSGSTLYGMTYDGGSSGDGTVFQIITNGTGFTILHNFGGPGDGSGPSGSPALSGSTLYGMTTGGGSTGWGTVFQISIDGTGYSIIHNFLSSYGDTFTPEGSPTLSGSTLYGMTTGGGTGGKGVIFALGISGGCSYSISSPSASYGSGGGSGSVSVTAGAGCGWTATSNDGWINITSGSSGTGNGSANYSVTSNSAASSRSGSLTIAGQTFTVTQSGNVPTAPTITTASQLPSGLAGSTYSTTLAASGGSPPYAWLVTAGGLPSGLSLNSASGAITGTPTTGVTTNFIVRVTGNDGLYSEAIFHLTVIGPPPTITTTSTLPVGVVGVAYSQDLMATGGTPPYTWSVNSAYLPTGLSLSGSTISGTPSVVHRSYFLIRCTGSDGGYSENSFSILISSNLTVATPTISPAGGTFTNTVTVTLACTTDGATIHYTTDGSDPTSISMSYSSPFTVTSNGTVNAKAVMTGDTDSDVASATFTIIKTSATVATPTITPAGGTSTNSQKVTLGCATVGATIRYTTDGSDPISSSSAYKKTALTLTNSVTLKAKAFKGANASAVATESFTIIHVPLAIPPISPPGGQVKVSYPAGVKMHATGGIAPYKWSWAAQTGSKLPTGLTLNATTGAITGKPTKAGTFNLTVKVTDAKKQTATQALTMTIASP